MKLALPFAVAILMALPVFSQAPSNDDFNCATMVDLGIAPSCPGTIFTNINATPSLIATVDTVSCFNNAKAQRDVWFKFVCSDTLFDYRIYLKSAGGTPIGNPEFAIYRGDCIFNGLGEIACVRANVGEDSISVDLFNLTPNESYYIRVSDWSATGTPNSGQFTLCVDEIPPILTINQGGSSLCNGTLYDTGGANNDYSANEDHTFVICPDQPSACILFTLEYYHLEPSPAFFSGQGDQLSFYNGPTANSPLLAGLDGAGFSQENVAGGGGVCFQVKATSGCLTVRFKSDGSVQEEGWKGTWTCSSDACIQEETIQIDTTVAAADIQGAVSTGGAMVTVTSIDCPQGGMGTFTYPTDNNALNMQKGLLLTSGQALNALGPNNAAGTTSQNAPFFADDPGDADLAYLSTEFGSGSITYDACIVELDVFAATNEVVFEYVFGSEEYAEYVFNQYNDIFAFLVSGPGIVGDPNLSNSALNIATLPNSATLVQIDSVNNQVNWQYYRNNELSQTLEYDGLTSDFMGVKKSLTARVPVTPCNTYHLKLAIADRGDESFDSGVFVSEIKAGSPNIEITFSSGLDHFIENCTGSTDTLFITLDKVPTVITEFNITLGGTATPVLDYLLNIPPVITFLPGQQTLAFPIIPIGDNLVEGTETITITLSRDYGCGSVDLKTIKVDIFDNVQVVVQGGDTLTICKGDFLQLTASGATNYIWEPQDQVSNAYIPNPFTSPAQSVWLEVTGVVGTCVDVDSVFIQVIAPTITATNLTPNIICLGGSVQLQAVSSEPNITWTPATGLDDPNSATPIATPTFPVTYTASATLAGCTVQAFVTITVDTLQFPTVINDLVQCQNFPVKLANTLNTTTTYSWSPATGLNDPNVSGPIALPNSTTTYILTATSLNGVCEQKDTVTVTITPADIDILGPDSLKICLGSDPIQLTTSANPGGSIVKWSPSDYLSSNTGASVTVTPLETVTIIASYEVNGCPPVLDSVYIRVDSLPTLNIFASPDKAFYCPGDTIYLLSPLYAPGNATSGFPGITHTWEPFGTQLTPLDKFQMIIIATDSNLYIRITQIGACLDTATVFIPVPTPPELPFTIEPNPICPGGSAQIIVTPFPANTTLEWDEMTSNTLSCDKCPNPIATPLTTTTYRLTTPDALCPSGADITVIVSPLPALNLANNPVSCAGAPVVLNGTNESGATYIWSPPLYLNNPNIGNPTATPTQPGVTTYTVEAEKDGCKAEGSVTLTAYLAGIDITTPAQDVCAGTALTLNTTTTGTPGTIGWLPAGPGVTPTATTTYLATLFYGMGCVAQDSVTITVTPIPLLNLANNPVSCAGAPVVLNGTNENGVTYTWSPILYLNNPTVGNPTATPTTSGVTTYTVEADNNGCKASGSVTLSAYIATVDITTPPQSICAGTPLTLTATTTGTPGTVSWSPAGPTVTPTAPTTYTANLAYGMGCTVKDSVFIGVFQLPVLNLNDTTVCQGAAVSLNGNPQSGVVYIWTPSTGLNNPNIGNPLATPLLTTTYQVEATTIVGGCKATGSVVVNVANASVSLGPDQTICFGQSATLTAVVTGTSGGTFTWSPGITQITASVSVSPTADQAYTVTYKYGDNNTCSASDAAIVFVGDELKLSNITGPLDSVCAGSPVVLKVTVTKGIGTLSWLADGVVIAGQTKDSITVIPSGNDVVYSAVITDAAGCTAISDAFKVSTKKCYNIPNAFTPNGDSANDTFGPIFSGGNAEVVYFSIYNRWGQKVFEATPQQKEWDGKQDGKPASSDVYVYKLQIRFGNGDVLTDSGEVTLLR